MSWYKRAEVLTNIDNAYSINEIELGRIFTSLWLELVSISKYKNDSVICKFRSPKLEGNMLFGTLKELEAHLGRVKGVIKAKAKLFDYTVLIQFDKEINV